jgi:hypothetical protein
VRYMAYVVTALHEYLEIKAGDFFSPMWVCLLDESHGASECVMAYVINKQLLW